MEAAKRRPPRGGFYWMPPIGGSFSGESISMAVAPWPWWRCNNNDDKKNNSNENKNKNYYVCYPFPWKESMSDPLEASSWRPPLGGLLLDASS